MSDDPPLDADASDPPQGSQGVDSRISGLLTMGDNQRLDRLAAQLAALIEAMKDAVRSTALD